MDSPRKKALDSKRCSLQPHEVRGWCRALNCTPREYALAVRAAWAMRGVARPWLVKNELKKADIRLARAMAAARARSKKRKVC